MSRYEANVAEMAASSNVFPVMYKGEVIEKYFVSKEGDFFGPRKGLSEPLTVHYPTKKDTNPYPRVAIGGGITCHSLMAHTFVAYPTEDRPDGFEKLPKKWQKYIVEKEKRYVMELQVDHKNGDKYDWSIDNLRWCTAKENQQYYQNEQKGKK